MPIAPAFAIVGADVRDAHGRAPGDAALRAFAADLAVWSRPPAGRSGTRDTTRRSRPRFAVRGGMVVGTLEGDADPLRPLLANALAPEPCAVRWSIAAGPPGDALLGGALDALDLARARRDGLILRTPEPDADRLLDAIAPLLPELLAEMTERQRELGRILILEGGRQADAAEALGVSRATVSVMAARGRVRSIERLAAAVRALVWAAVAAASDIPADPAGSGVLGDTAGSGVPAAPAAFALPARPR